MWRHLGEVSIRGRMGTIERMSPVSIQFSQSYEENMLEGLPREYDVIVIGTGREKRLLFVRSFEGEFLVQEWSKALSLLLVLASERQCFMLTRKR